MTVDMTPSKDPSIENEPHFQRRNQPEPKPAKPGPASDAPDGLHVPAPVFSKHSNEHIDYSVWDEPGVSGMVGKPSPDALTYDNWLRDKQAQWSQGKAWIAAAIVALLSAPWAFLIVGLSGFETGYQGSSGGAVAVGALVACGFIPLIQEIAKIALPLWVVVHATFATNYKEKRPAEKSYREEMLSEPTIW